MSKIEVYISYSREKEDKSKSIEKMRKQLGGIDFKIDTKEVGVRDNFKDFISKIGQAKHVVVVFCEAYFKSFYCMYELLKIIEHGGVLKDRVFVIREEEYFLSNIGNQNIIKEYWEEVVDSQGNRTGDLTDYGAQEEVEEIHSTLDDIFERFSTVNGIATDELISSSYESLFSEGYQEIWQWLRETKTEENLKGKKQTSDEDFIVLVEKGIEVILKKNSVLYDYVKEIFTHVNNETELAKLLCCEQDQVEFFEMKFMKACKHAIESTTGKAHTKIVSDVRTLLNHLCIMAINPEWVKHQNTHEGTIITIPVETDFGGVVAAGRRVQVIPNLSATEHNQVVNKYEISPFKGESWDNKKGIVIDAILRFVFNTVMEISQLKGKGADLSGKITEGECKQLNKKIALSSRVGDKHIYCMLRKGETAAQFVDSPEIISELKEKLPALDIFILKTKREDNLFLAVDENELSQTYHYFLTELDKW